MFLVVNLHVLGRGGILQKATGVQYAAAYLLEIASYCAVNCYAIISGYVGYREQKLTLHYAKYFKFWIPVAFYNVAITSIMFAIGVGNVSKRDVVLSIFPVTMARYWYVNAYTALFFLIPWLNEFLKNYLSFTVVLEAIGFVVIFSRMKLSSTGIAIVRKFSPAAFGVYLIHTQYLVFEHCIGDAFSGIANAPVWIMVLEVFGAAGFIFAACLVIDKVRLLLFEILKINRLISIIEKVCGRIHGFCRSPG